MQGHPDRSWARTGTFLALLAPIVTQLLTRSSDLRSFKTSAMGRYFHQASLEFLIGSTDMPYGSMKLAEAACVNPDGVPSLSPRLTREPNEVRQPAEGSPRQWVSEAKQTSGYLGNRPQNTIYSESVPSNRAPLMKPLRGISRMATRPRVARPRVQANERRLRKVVSGFSRNTIVLLERARFAERRRE